MVIILENINGKKFKFDKEINFIIFMKNEFEDNLENESILKNIKTFNGALTYLVNNCLGTFPKITIKD